MDLANFSSWVTGFTLQAFVCGPGCIPCKTYTNGTPGPKLSYARYFQGEKAAKNLSNDVFKELSVLAQILRLVSKKCMDHQKKLLKDPG